MIIILALRNSPDRLEGVLHRRNGARKSVKKRTVLYLFEFNVKISNYVFIARWIN